MATHLRLIDSAEDLRSEAMARAGRMLALRPRTEKELRDRLREADFGDEVVEDTIERLYELKLLDDEDFAVKLIRERSRRAGLGPKALRAELQRRGVDRSTADAALTRSGLDEETAATELAEKLVRRWIRHPVAAQAGKLQQALLRKGYSWDAAEAAVKAVLPPEGWD